MVTPRRREAAAAAVAGLAVWMAAPAAGQDSVAPGAAGDALDAYAMGVAAAGGGQVADYVVDLSPVTSSWGGRYAIGPVVKSSRSTSAAGALNHFIGAQAAGATLSSGVFPRGTYAAWAAAGQGVLAGVNDPPVDDGSGLYGVLGVAGRRAWRTGAAVHEFGAGPDGVLGTGDDENNILAASIALQTRRVNRLYVSRVAALTNKFAPGAAGANTASASLGLGGVDDLGTVHLLADGFGLLAPNRLMERRLMRVRALQRDPAVINRLQGAGAADAAATATLLGVPAGAVLTTPGIIPESAAGRPVLLGTDFASNLLHEAAPGSLAPTRDHLPTPADSSRGNLSFVARPFAPLASGGSDAGTAALLGRTDGGTLTRAIDVFGVNTDGSVDAQRRLTLPAAGLVDPADGFDPAAAFPTLAEHEFAGYGSQASFRGGNGQTALAVLDSGDLLAAALVAPTGGAAAVPSAPDGYIAVARVSAATGEVAWTIAAHTGDAMGAAGNTSKAIRQDADGDGVLDAAPLGRLALRTELPGSPAGPSISAPSMDSAGNVYFFASVRLDTAPIPEWTTALIRANYNPALGPAGGAGGYELELLARIGDVVHGANSRTDYRIEYLSVADSNSVDSGSMWSGCLMPARLPLVPPAAAAAYGSPLSLGTLVFRARILYDVNADGMFVDPTLPGGAGSPDQAYNAAMVLMPAIAAGDANRDGVVNSTDISAFLTLWLADVTGGTAAVDWDGSGGTNSTDISAFLTDWLGSVN